MLEVLYKMRTYILLWWLMLINDDCDDLKKFVDMVNYRKWLKTNIFALLG